MIHIFSSQITTLFCLVALAAGVPIPPIGLGYGGVGLGYGGVGIGGVSHIGGLGLSRINGLGIGSVGYGGLGSVGYGGLGVSSIGLGHSAIGYAPGHIGYGSAIAAPAIIPGLAVPKILAPAPVLHKTLISPPIVKAVAPIDPNPQYSFNYGVSDPHTGDNKHAEETLVNGVTHGSYSLTEPDGTVRKVRISLPTPISIVRFDSSHEFIPLAAGHLHRRQNQRLQCRRAASRRRSSHRAHSQSHHTSRACCRACLAHIAHSVASLRYRLCGLPLRLLNAMPETPFNRPNRFVYFLILFYLDYDKHTNTSQSLN